jgi:hypothetical protein
MHSCGSQTATRSARVRFSYLVVPLGYVPSTGSTLTRTSSPRPGIIAEVTMRTNFGACAATSGAGSCVVVTCSGNATPVQGAERVVDRPLVALQ